MAKGNRWKDHYTERAKAKNWLARSVYKLKEIDQKYGLIKKGNHVLDLGCYPGSWSQYCLKKVGEKGKVIGLDLKKPDSISFKNFRFIEADIFQIPFEEIMRETGEVDVLISDMAPQTTGIGITDVSRSLSLAEKALEIALILLKKRGHFLCKMFEGEDLKSFRKSTSHHFKRLNLIRPSAVRKRSREIYILGINFNG